MVKKLVRLIFVGILVMLLANTALAATTGGKYSGTSSHISTTVPHSPNIHRSGVQRPTGQVTYPTSPQYNYHSPLQPDHNYSPAPQPRLSGIGSFLGGMAVGGLLGSMFHPFGGGHSYYGGGYNGFPFLGFILDLVLIAAIVWLFRRLMRRA